MDAQDLTPAIDILEQRLRLTTLWLFGSEASGTATSCSDIDLACLFAAPVDIRDLLEARGDIALALERDVDLVDLDRSSPILAHQAIGSGRLLVDHDPSRRFRFLEHLPSRTEDVRIMRRPIERALLGRLRDG